MWVRSQDKKILGNFSVINISYEDPTKIIAWSSHLIENEDDSSVDLGEYETEERAIEVLDDIQQYVAKNNLGDSYIHKNFPDGNEKVYVVKNGVYQMPEK